MLKFEPGAVKRLAQIAFEVNERTENIGARRLATALEALLEEVSFEAPECSQRTILIDAAEVKRRLAPLAKNQDLSRFIL
jgi:ATP-dependent HslUV protease ATP-binding subunit HslU